LAREYGEFWWGERGGGGEDAAVQLGGPVLCHNVAVAVRVSYVPLHVIDDMQGDVRNQDGNGHIMRHLVLLLEVPLPSSCFPSLK
jgi:hypothetical protein